MPYANNKGADHPRSLISAFAVRCLDSMISLVSVFAISWLSYLVENSEDIIIITLFQEDNIFGMYASLTYGPQLQRYACHWQFSIHKLFTVCTEQVRSPYTEHAASGLPNPTPLEGEVRSVQAQDQEVVTTRSPRIITECLLTRSKLIKMYVHAIYRWFCIETILSNRKHEYEFITTIPIKFDESFQS